MKQFVFKDSLGCFTLEAPSFEAALEVLQDVGNDDYYFIGEARPVLLAMLDPNKILATAGYKP